MKKTSLFLFLIVLSDIACTEVIKPEIPIQISSVTTKLINEKLIRIIEYNITQQPKVIIEMLTRPRKEVIQRLEIKNVKYGDQILDFYKSAATSFESITVADNYINIDIYYVYPGKGGGSLDLTCKVKVTNSLSKPICHRK